ncbi:hypothetical protein [Desulfofarcimen acetoxidans]|uniref:hypothetical protein n=1 Tax=Desulfofarcimen acetoxidans TaxID=58138 RepID=UPI0002F89CB1|nr:hypothetical protein [Desulfofarcimen acetoxidans]
MAQSAKKERLLKMLIATFIDGLVLEGKTYEELVRKLRSTSFKPGKDVKEYMKDTQRRVQFQTGKEISYTDYESFILELVRVEIITNLKIQE